jgi:hypothetical protein
MYQQSHPMDFGNLYALWIAKVGFEVMAKNLTTDVVMCNTSSNFERRLKNCPMQTILVTTAHYTVSSRAQ